MVKKKNAILSTADNDDLYFLDIDASNHVQILHHLPVAHLLNGEGPADAIPEKLRQKVNTLLIVPDYWFGSAQYQFQSTRRSLVEPFLERKLRNEFPDRFGVLNFYDYTFSRPGQEDQGLYVYFLQEPKFFKLYDRLLEFKLHPRRITTPAYLWEQKLSQIIPDFQNSGTGLVHLISSICHLYFFFRGHFLFSRSIALPDNGSSERLNALSFEINQSIYLFSQKTKTDIGRFYLHAPAEPVNQMLSDALTREVRDLGIDNGQRLQVFESAESLEHVECFGAADLSPSARFPSVSHKLLKKELMWKPVQLAGIVIGLILVLLLALEAYFLKNWFQQRTVRMDRGGIEASAEPRQIIQEYNDALDLLLEESQRPSVTHTLIQIGEALPENAWIKDITIEMKPGPRVDLKGVVYAYGADHLRDSLTIFLSNLNTHFRGSRNVQIKDIDFEVIDDEQETGHSAYLFLMKFELP